MKLEPCNQDVFAHGVSLGLYDMPKEEAERYCQEQTRITGHLHDWHYVGGRVHIKALQEPMAKPEPEPEPEPESGIATADDKVGSWS